MASISASRINWPRPAVAGCVFCTFIRDTRRVPLDPAQRFNFFPASPLCAVTWTLAGDCHLIERPDQMERPWTGAKLPRIAFSGTQLGPLVSWNPGETFAIAIAFYPDALSAMTGLDLSSFTGRLAPVEEALPQPLLGHCHEFLDAVWREGVEKSCSAYENKIATMWSERRPAGNASIKWLKDWSLSLVVRAASSGPGGSARQIARRVKSITGMSERDLQGLGHTEQLYARLHEALQTGDIRWAELAAASGFADQSHMIRQMRRHTGFTPEQLRKSAQSDEAFWAYRLLGQYFTLPEG